MNCGTSHAGRAGRSARRILASTVRRTLTGACLLVLLAQPALAEKKNKKGGSPSTPVRKQLNPAPAPAATKAPSAAASLGKLSPDFEKLPTTIHSQSLTLNTDKRTFSYEGGVEVKHGEMTLTSERLDGTYSENNQLLTLAALNNVVITKGDTIKATSQKALYDAVNEVATLTDNPQLEENGSLLTAQLIKVFMKENRSTAEGDVRVTLINTKQKAQPTPAPAAAASPAPAATPAAPVAATPAAPKLAAPARK